MKYNEAIDMILDGGKARQKNEWYKNYWVEFDDDGILIVNSPDGEMYDYRLKRKYISQTDWIVEKDGMVYEAYQAPNEQGELAELEEDKHAKLVNKAFEQPGVKEEYFEILRNEMLKRIEMLDRLGSLHEKLEGEWLEKKMLCFAKKIFAVGGIKKVIKEEGNGVKFHFDASVCLSSNCPFCFPASKKLTASPYAPKNFEKVFGIKPDNPHHDTIEPREEGPYHEDCERCHHSIKQPCGKHMIEYVDGKSPEKVTENELADSINHLVSLHIAATIEKSTKKLVKAATVSLELKRKLQYLLSLQEKN